MFSRLATTVAACLMAAAPPTLGAQAELQGRVLSGAKRPIANAVVWIPALNLRTVSDTQGKFRIEKIPSGDFMVLARAVGFSTGFHAHSVRAERGIGARHRSGNVGQRIANGRGVQREQGGRSWSARGVRGSQSARHRTLLRRRRVRKLKAATSWRRVDRTCARDGNRHRQRLACLGDKRSRWYCRHMCTLSRTQKR